MIFLTKRLESNPTMEDEVPNSTPATTSPTKGKDKKLVQNIKNLRLFFYYYDSLH